jgi:hypothetical protein
MADKKDKPSAGRKWFNGRSEELVIAQLCEVWGIGGSDAEAAYFADIPASSLSRYLEVNPDIKQRRDALREKPILDIRRCVIEAAKLDPELGLKVLERLRKMEFSTKSEIEHGLSIPLEQLISKANKPDVK